MTTPKFAQPRFSQPKFSWPGFASIAPAALVALALIATGGTATATITSRDDNHANPRGWSAVAGMDTRAVIELARHQPLTQDTVPGRPWCDHSDQVAQTLTHDFDEHKIATGNSGTQLWGSALMGTWTMVLDRGDATSCIVASGVGYSDGASPRVFFTRAGLNG